MLHRFDCAKFTMRIWRRAQREWLFNPRSNRRRTSSPSPEKGSERTNSGARHRSPAGADGEEVPDDPGVADHPDGTDPEHLLLGHGARRHLLADLGTARPARP